ncbi:MAG: GAF domain-containing protein [Colwellia sp.]|nr:GAF domain-containing protein [Colwellia sp.]
MESLEMNRNILFNNALASLQKVGEITASQQSLPDALENIAIEINIVLQSDMVIIYQYDDIGNRFLHHPIIVPKKSIENTVPMTTVVREDDVPWRILKKKKPYFTSKSQEDSVMKGQYVEREGFVKRERIKASAGMCLIVNNVALGILFVNYRTDHFFSEDEKIIFEIFGFQLAQTIQASRFLNRKWIIDFVSIISDFTIKDKIEDILYSVLEKAVDLVGGVKQGASGWIFWSDEVTGKLIPKTCIGFPENKLQDLTLEIGEGICGSAVKEKETKNIPYVGNYKDGFIPNYVPHRADTQSELAVPLWFGKKVLGVLNIESMECNAFSLDIEEKINKLSAIASIGVEDFILRKKLDHQTQSLMKLHEVVAESITQNLDQKPILRLLARNLGEVTKADFSLIYLYDEKKDIFTDMIIGDISSGWDACEPRKNGIGARALKSRKLERVDEREMNYFPKRKHFKTSASYPFYCKNGQQGVIYLNYLKPYTFTNEEGKLQEISKKIATIIEKISLNQEIEIIKKSFSDKFENLKINKDIFECTEADIVLINLHDKKSDKPKPKLVLFAGLNEEWVKKCKPRKDGTGRDAIRTQKPVYILTESDVQKRLNSFAQTRGVKNSVAWPIIYKGRTLAVVYLHFLEMHDFSDYEKKAIQIFTESAGMMLENIKASQNTINLAKEFGHDIKQTFASSQYDINCLKNFIDKSKKDKIRDILEKLENKKMNMHDHINKLLDISFNLPKISCSDILLNDLLDDLIKEFKSEVEIKRISLEKQFDPRLKSTKINTDKDQLMNACRNLLRNAIEALVDLQDGVINIKTRFDKDNDKFPFSIKISDNGHGIADPDKSIFDGISSKGEKRGLGLKITQNIIQNRLKGEIIPIINEQQLRRGLTFNINLPAIIS